jgi:hypothetical protein
VIKEIYQTVFERDNVVPGMGGAYQESVRDGSSLVPHCVAEMKFIAFYRKKRPGRRHRNNP